MIRLPWRPNSSWLVVVLLLLVGIAGVTSTYMQLSETDDELFHISCGMLWWRDGVYTINLMHSPLARIAGAALPYWMHIEDAYSSVLTDSPVSFYQDYFRRLWLSRLGILPFYVFSCVLVYVWSDRLFGQVAGVCSLVLYVTLSTVTGNAGLATTDMVYTCMLLWALLCGVSWLEKPDLKRSLWLGVSIGLMIGSKFSGLVQWPVAMMLILDAKIIENSRRKLPLIPLWRRYIAFGLVVLPVMFLVIGAIYRFSFAPLWQGIYEASEMNRKGFSVWLYGPLHNTSRWYFFPVVFFFKTPLAFFIAALMGFAVMLREKNGPVEAFFPFIAAVGVLAISMTSHVNLGVRHVLALYPLLAIPAGKGLAWLWQGRGWKRVVGTLLMLWQVAGFVRAYPEHIAYFNELAGAHPEHITLDSDFDWGQNVILLNEVMEQRHIDGLYLCARKDAVWNAVVITQGKIGACPRQPVEGWLAVSRAFKQQHPDYFTWLKEDQAVQSIGRTMDLYYISPSYAP